MSTIIPHNNTKQQCRWHSYPTTSSLEHAAVLVILNASQHAISQHGEFNIVLAGGTTPRRVYELLRTMDANWKAWHVYFGDERCLPVDHTERNSHMAVQAWLDHVSIPASQIHTIPAEQGAQTAASAYAQTLSKVELFDLVILGLGEDGHTASLFPHHDWEANADSSATLAVLDAPKPPSERVSMSARRLSQTRQLMFLVTGATKQQAILDWRNGVEIPAAAIVPDSGVDIYLEEILLTEMT